MGFWSKVVLGKEDKTPEQLEKERYESTLPKCASCNEAIYPEDEKTFDKKKYHIKCFRKQLKIARRQAASGHFNIG